MAGLSKALAVAVVLAPLVAACAGGTPLSAVLRPVPAPEPAADRALAARVAGLLAERDGSVFRAVTVAARDGRVLLMGAVAKPDQRRQAETIARATEGVRGVLDEVVLAEERAYDLFRPDPVLESDLRQRLVALPDIGVRVVNKVAFLLGHAGTPAEVAAAKALAMDADGIKWVVVHVEVR